MKTVKRRKRQAATGARKPGSGQASGAGRPGEARLPAKCPACGKPVGGRSKACSACGLPLDPAAVRAA